MLKNLVCYTPYGFSVCDLGTMVLNSFFYVICWKKFALTRLNIDECIKYCDNKDYGVSFSGYAKMDPMLDNDLGKSAHWKIADGFKENDVKKIIFAPHHSIAAVPFFSTFSKNKDFFLKYAHDHNETSWIIKPHPLLRVSSVKNHCTKVAARRLVKVLASDLFFFEKQW